MGSLGAALSTQYSVLSTQRGTVAIIQHRGIEYWVLSTEYRDTEYRDTEYRILSTGY
jgi:hypothetical protein